MNLTNKIIPIDEDTRIKLLPDNFMLQFRVKTRTNRMAWHTEGYYPDMTSLSHSYLNHAPYRAIQSTEALNEVIAIIKQAETNIIRAIAKITTI